MRKRIALICGIALAAVLAFSSAGMADTLTFNHTVVPLPVGEAGLYAGTLNGGSINMVCDDLVDTVHAGDTWTVSMITLAQIVTAPGNNAGQKFLSFTAAATTAGITNIVQAYEAALFIAGEIFAGPQAQWPDLNQELWAIFDPGASLTGAQASALMTAVTNALGEPMSFYASYVILTPNPATQGKLTPQEMIEKTSVPETSSAFLVVVALAGLFLMGRRKLLEA